MSYVQGFLIAVPKDKKAEYLQAARATATMFAECGALRTVETWSEDIVDGKVTDFKRAVLAKPDEAIVFSWIEWPDKKTCEEASRKMEADDRWKDLPEMPFDSMRMIWGGFEPILDTAA